MSILKTEHLIKQYGKEPNIVRALDDVSISVEPGEFVAIIGTSGSGNPPCSICWAGWIDPPPAV